MTGYFRRHLGAKLLLSYLAIIVVGLVALIITSQSEEAEYGERDWRRWAEETRM